MGMFKDQIEEAMVQAGIKEIKNWPSPDDWRLIIELGKENVAILEEELELEGFGDDLKKQVESQMGKHGGASQTGPRSWIVYADSEKNLKKVQGICSKLCKQRGLPDRGKTEAWNNTLWESKAKGWMTLDKSLEALRELEEEILVNTVHELQEEIEHDTEELERLRVKAEVENIDIDSSDNTVTLNEKDDIGKKKSDDTQPI